MVILGKKLGVYGKSTFRYVKNRPWILVALSALLLFGLSLAMVTAPKKLEKKASHTSAMLYQLNNELSAIPSPNTITPGKTSGNLDGLVGKQEALVSSTERSIKNLNYSPFPALLDPIKASQLSQMNDATKPKLEGLKRDINDFSALLSTSKKFVEYNPTADLTGLTPESPDRDERLRRTKSGIETFVQDMKKSSGELPRKMSEPAAALLKDFNALTEGNNFSNWNTRVAAAQSEVIELLNKEWLSLKQKQQDMLQSSATDYARLYQ